MQHRINRLRLLRMWFITLLNSLATIEAMNAVQPGKCRSWCITNDAKHCSDVYPCHIDYRIDGLTGNNGTAPPPPTHFQAHLKCYFNGVDLQIGLDLSWDIAAKELGKLVDYFQLNIQDHSGNSPSIATSISIIPENRTHHGPLVHFEYFYTGHNESVILYGSGKYSVNVQSISKHRIATEKPIQRLKITVTENFIEHEECKNTSRTVTTGERKSPVNIFIILLVAVGVLLVIAAITAVKVRRPRSTPPNILILMNTHGLNGEDISKKANHMATAMKKATRMGPPHVKHNRWDTNRIAEVGILAWMRENIDWADKIIIISIPDELRSNNNEASAFENAFQSVIDTYTLKGQSLTSSISIVHFGDLEKHIQCPHMRNTEYRRFRLDNDWEQLCRYITGNIELQPLNG